MLVLLLHVLQMLTVTAAATVLVIWAWVQLQETKRSEAAYRRECARARQQLISLIGVRATDELMGDRGKEAS